jgi:DNA-binding FadR family transcriptional regulator
VNDGVVVDVTDEYKQGHTYHLRTAASTRARKSEFHDRLSEACQKRAKESAEHAVLADRQKLE